MVTLLSRHCGRHRFAEFHPAIQSRIERIVRHFQDVDQHQHLPILDLTYPHLDFRYPAAAQIPSRFLKFDRELRLRPAAPASNFSHLPTYNILVLHAPRWEAPVFLSPLPGLPLLTTSRGHTP